ncbi:MAG TPA: HNH endonuclease [Caldilineaceae bacterium]|nr:HNH endonuclease [Caldilineaceae bacterium]
MAMKKQVFICTYGTREAFNTSKQHGLLGFSTNNTGAKGSIAKLKMGDFVVVRDNTKKDSLTCFGVFEITGAHFEADPKASLIWQEELTQGKIVFTSRIPAQYINVSLPPISKNEILSLGWKKREKPYSKYKWQGLSRLFAVSFLKPLQAQQLAKLWGIDFENLNQNFSNWQTPDELQYPTKLIEGAKKQVTVNAYERNPQAREECIKHYGYNCSVCGFNFEMVYGNLGKIYTHVHHLVALASIGDSYVIDPINDLRPVCANCHAMLHQRDPAFSTDELKAIINANVKR